MEQSKQSTAVFAFLQKIPKGKVVTYQQVARACNIANPRYVGYIIHRNPDWNTFPCHRVVRSDLTVATGYAFGGQEAQIRKLKEEGVEFIGKKIDPLCLWENA